MAGVQIRLATSLTGEHYVTARLWTQATITSCPWHADGRCGFSRHGTYERVTPAGCRVARWYCPEARRTVSALPDCLASHRTGTLIELERRLRALEQAGSLSAAAHTTRTEIELPGALRYLTRLRRDLYAALSILRALDPERFANIAITLCTFASVLGVSDVLMVLRADYARHLPQLPVPLGFNPRRTARDTGVTTDQHRSGRDPPHRLIEACVFVHTPKQPPS